MFENHAMKTNSWLSTVQKVVLKKRICVSIPEPDCVNPRCYLL